MGRKISCSSNLNKHIGSCISTLVSSTNNLVGEFCFFFSLDAESISLFAGKAGMSEACERDCTAFAGLVFLTGVATTDIESVASGLAFVDLAVVEDFDGIAVEVLDAESKSALLRGAGGSGMGLETQAVAAAFLSALTAFKTSSTWPGTLRPRHSCLSTPSGPTKKVLRSMPLTFLPYMILFLTTPNM